MEDILGVGRTLADEVTRSMSRLRVGVVRYPSVATAVENAIGGSPAPEFRIGQWRTTLTFHGIGASRWPEHRQVEFALHVAGIARDALAAQWRRAVRSYAERAIEVVYEDAALVEGCAVTSRWECVVPASHER